MEDILATSAVAGDADLDASLRPRRLEEFVGQPTVKEQLTLVLDGAKGRGASADHLLFSGPPGLGKPVSVDTLILMGDGTRRRIGDVSVGDTVISHRGLPRRVTAVYEQGELLCLRIKTHTGREVVAAPEHPFLTPHGWKKAADLEPGEVLANVPTPTTTGVSDLSDEEFRLAGYRLRKHGMDNVLSVDTRVSAFVFGGSPSQIGQFLAAYFACDGFGSGSGQDRYDAVVEYDSTSQSLLADIQHLLLRLGIQSRLKLNPGRYDNHRHESWRLTITSRDDVARFSSWPLIGDRARRLKKHWNPQRDRFDEELLADRITAVEVAGLTECRCITVAEDASYTVNDLVCHNTSLAGIVATEMGADLRATSGPALERPGDLAAILTNLEAGDVLFIDEIHRLPRTVEEILYPAMEDFSLDIVVGKGPGARAIRLPLPMFTLVGATTRTGLITSPLRDRFGFAARLDYYDRDQLADILRRSADILGMTLHHEGAREIAGRSRGTPRIANRLLKRVRDYAEVRADGVVTADVANRALEVFEVDARGLDKLDRWVLEALCRDFDGGPVGLTTLAVAVGEESDTVEEVVEPFLIQQGLLARTPRGRVATPQAWAHLGIDRAAQEAERGTLFT